MQNIPEKIYIQIGEEVDTDEDIDFNELAEVSWCSDKIYDNDLVYFNNVWLLDFFKKHSSYELQQLLINSILNK